MLLFKITSRPLIWTLFLVIHSIPSFAYPANGELPDLRAQFAARLDQEVRVFESRRRAREEQLSTLNHIEQRGALNWWHEQREAAERQQEILEEQLGPLPVEDEHPIPPPNQGEQQDLREATEAVQQQLRDIREEELRAQAASRNLLHRMQYEAPQIYRMIIALRRRNREEEQAHLTEASRVFAQFIREIQQQRRELRADFLTRDGKEEN